MAVLTVAVLRDMTGAVGLMDNIFQDHLQDLRTEFNEFQDTIWIMPGSNRSFYNFNHFSVTKSCNKRRRAGIGSRTIRDGYDRGQLSDINAARAYAIKAAHYPRFYERLKTPLSAKQALKSEATSTPQNAQRRIPSQSMTISSPVVQKSKEGNQIVFNFAITQNHPIFFLCCQYRFLDKVEKFFDGGTTTQAFNRLSYAQIATDDLQWNIAFEQKGYNDVFLQYYVGEEEYARLEAMESRTIQGTTYQSPGHSSIALKLLIPDGYDLAGLRCEAPDFYTLKFVIPEYSENVAGTSIMVKEKGWCL